MMDLGLSRKLILVRTSHTGGGTVTRVQRGIKGRARQVLHIVGYHFWMQTSPTPTADNQSWEMFGALQVDERDHGRQPVDFFDSSAAPQPSRSARIDQLFIRQENIEDTAVGNRLNGRIESTGWVVCNLVVPGFHLFTSVSGTLAETYEAGVTLEYDWITVGLDDLAAVNLHWGQDPNDFDRS